MKLQDVGIQHADSRSTSVIHYVVLLFYAVKMNITTNRGFIIQARPETPEFIRGAILYGTWIIHPNDSSISKVLHCAREEVMENGTKYDVCCHSVHCPPMLITKCPYIIRRIYPR